MPHEVFLSAIVASADEARARALLGGFTEMRERHRITRVQHFEPRDPTAKGFPAIKDMQKKRPPAIAQWQELHQILAKQPCVLQVRADITEQVRGAEMGGPRATIDPGDAPKPPVVRWTEFPEPTNPRLPFLTQRRILDIADPEAERTLTDNKFKVKSDLVEESYHWWLNDVEYALTRTFVVSLSPDPATSWHVSNMASMEPVAPFWTLHVRSMVDSLPSTTVPERMKQAQARLVQVREQLMGVFDFRPFDRRCHDTRIHETRQG